MATVVNSTWILRENCMVTDATAARARRSASYGRKKSYDGSGSAKPWNSRSRSPATHRLQSLQPLRDECSLHALERCAVGPTEAVQSRQKHVRGRAGRGRSTAAGWPLQAGLVGADTGDAARAGSHPSHGVTTTDTAGRHAAGPRQQQQVQAGSRSKAAAGPSRQQVQGSSRSNERFFA